MSNGNWSTETQTYTHIAILESQIEVKETKIGNLKEKCNLLELENIQLKDDVDRLNGLICTITVGQTNLLDRFK